MAGNNLMSISFVCRTDHDVVAASEAVLKALRAVGVLNGVTSVSARLLDDGDDD